MDNTVKAQPTKDFFIQMLTKDIKLERAIIDLIDNSIDGAKNLKAEENFSGLWIKIKISANEFSIHDNCGGFSLNTAKNYAFMFGRPVESEHQVKHSVGRFGVGMKRALFKIGKSFEVETKNAADHFQVNVNVEDWSTQAGEWTFGYKLITPEANDVGAEDGTFIKVTNLNPDVLDEFGSDTFLRSLRDEIERTLSFSLDKGLEIELNGNKLKKSGLALLEYDKLQPFYKTFIVGAVNVKVYAGIGKASPDMAGWYIYCNDRLVLEKDKTNLTGWEGRRFGESSVQKFHHIYAMFRGIVFFSSDDAKALPMTTTKTGIDSNSAVYKTTKLEMINAMTQVIEFLKGFDSDGQREAVITSSVETDVIELSKKVYADRFVYPVIANIEESNDNMTTVSFLYDKEKVKVSKKYFNVSTNKECGVKVFDYFIKMEEKNLA